MTKEFKDEMLEETKGMLHPDLNVPKSIERAAKLAIEVQNIKVAWLNNPGDETLQEKFYDDLRSAVTALDGVFHFHHIFTHIHAEFDTYLDLKFDTDHIEIYELERNGSHGNH
ncbi:unnamed protein product [Symbiodinium natans]|uniref:Uncharacterized protein n=1 Tax=Symbiodinium natans TaxID=878477 RepID=A0A812GSW7_9DINO|nr:unnamed protein product [Symbiodinium natans]